MSGKVARLRGLMRLRALEEEVERQKLEMAAAAVAEVDAALRIDVRAAADARETSRAALRSGDRREWLTADAQGEVACANMDRLRPLRNIREEAVPLAWGRWMASKLEQEQAKVLVREAERVHSSATRRREQAEADEWMLSRWNRRSAGNVKTP